MSRQTGSAQISARTVIEWAAVVLPIIYVLSRWLWAAGLPIGIEEARMDELNLPGRGSITLVLLSIPALLTAWFTWWFPIQRNQSLPAWLPVLGGVALSRTLIIIVLLIPIVILAYSNAVNVLVMTTDLAPSDDMDALPGWSLWAHLLLFFGWWVSLVVVTWIYVRRPGSALNENA